mmetsp:Transcript_1533/g.2332  ORF Transcript_1533/g.2332 Transcript_1533/m.2332 type:complete len:556 (+) Transcript_1533:79-1746(+)
MIVLLILKSLLVCSVTAEIIINGYNLRFSVVHLLGIDKDLEEIKISFSTAGDDGFAEATKLYVEGANDSGVSVAHLTLPTPLSRAIPIDSELEGESLSGENITGRIYGNGGSAGDKHIKFQYGTTDNSLKCQLSNNFNEDDTTAGCLKRRGSLIVQKRNIEYSYDPFTDNDKGVTLQSFSAAADRHFNDCKMCPYDDYLKFRKYYGSITYADDRIAAAFDGVSTNFIRGNTDFALYSRVGRGEAIKKTVVFMSIWMTVIGKMEAAVGLCNPYNCEIPNDCNPESVHAWDEAVALYTGSLEDEDDPGILLYAEAETRCKEFNTCKRGREKKSINEEIFDLFRMAQKDITNSKCNTLIAIKNRIVQLMTVPLIQSTLRYAYINNYQTMNDVDRAKAQSEGATYAASVVPMLHFCEKDNVQSQRDAQLIYELMTVGPSETKFTEVKKAFERHYGCLGLSCEDIGGIYDQKTKSYLHNTKPCIDAFQQDVEDVEITLIILLIILGSITVVTCCFLPCRRRRLMKKGEDQGSVEEDGLANTHGDDDDMEIISLNDGKGLI